MVISSVVVYSVAEAGFIVLLALFFWIAALRKNNKKQKLLVADLRETIDTLKNRPLPSQQSENTLHMSANEPVDSQNANSLKLQLKKVKKELVSSKQQLTNMQQYKELYFKLEKLLSEQKNTDDMGDAARIDVLEKTLTEQEYIIDEMKTQLEIQPNDKTEQYIEQLERTIKQLEHSNGTLRTEIEQREIDLQNAEHRNEEIQKYRSQALTLQTTEKRLNAELIHVKTELCSATEEIEKNSEKLAEYRNLKLILRDKEEEIKNLKSECDMLESQYHDLAMQSLDDVSENVSQEKKDEIRILRATLKETLQELEKKKTECETLERSYQEMELTNEFQIKAEQLESSLADRTALEKTAAWLSTRAFELKGESGSEFGKLKNLLEGKTESLSQSECEQEEIENKMFKLADSEPSKHDIKMERLQQQNSELKRKFKTLKVNNEKLREKEKAYIKLQEEYNQLETRYLNLAQDAICR